MNKTESTVNNMQKWLNNNKTVKVKHNENKCLNTRP